MRKRQRFMLTGLIMFGLAASHPGGAGGEPPAGMPSNGTREVAPSGAQQPESANVAGPDGQEADWADGLLTYLAELSLSEQRPQGWEHRKGILTDYQSYVRPDAGKSLRAYSGAKKDRASRAVGYGKGEMVFHMLRQEVGDEAFFRALRDLIERRKTRKALWADLRACFEQASGRSLEGFFAQWLDRPDIPTMTLRDTRVTYLDGVPTVSFRLTQTSGAGAGPFSLKVPVRITTETGDISKTIRLDKAEETFSLPVSGNPVSLTVDPDYDLMRTLSQDEFAPVLSRFLGDENRLAVLSIDDERTCSGLVEALRARGIPIKSEKDVRDADISASSLLLPGGTVAIQRRLFANTIPDAPPIAVDDPGVRHDEPVFRLSVRKNPLNTAKVVVVVDCASGDETNRVGGEIFRYGAYSTLAFEGDRNVLKATVETDRGISKDLRHRVLGLRPAQTTDIDEIVQAIVDRPVIYIGESHTNYEDHKVQFEVIRRMHEGGHRFAIGMEMFQLPFQKALDDYLAGKIGEKEFLKQTEYFDRWRFDYVLYKEIIDYAKAKGIPVIALNTDAEIIRKVARGGLDAVSEAERERIPRDMDMTNEEYRDRLAQVFRQQQHEQIEKMGFENFYQSQVLWDETMAHAVSDFMATHPDYQMVVLAGTGHIMYGSGIPDRVRRLTGKDHAILVSANIPEWGPTVADYVLFPEPLPPPESPKLGVVTLDGKDGLMIDEVVPHGAAAAAGLEKGDVIVSIDDTPVRTIGDVKIALLDRKSGDIMKIRIKRKKSPGVKKEQDIQVTLR